MHKNMSARGLIICHFATNEITCGPQKRGPTGRPAGVFDAGSVGVGDDATLAQYW